jgi:serine/threonine-protein kinase
VIKCGRRSHGRISPRPASHEGEAVLAFFPKTRSNTPGAFVINAGAEPSPGYQLRRARGRGGFAEVWEASSPTGPCALKFMVSANAGTTAR